MDDTYVITTVDLAEATSWSNTPPLEQDDTVFIVVICLLGVVIVVISVIAFIGWWFWIRPYDLPTRKDSNSSQNNFVDSSSIIGFSNPTNGDVVKDRNEIGVSNLSFENGMYLTILIDIVVNSFSQFVKNQQIIRLL